VSVKGTGRDGRPDLPGEHGFRFFPRFYRHVTDTMKRIPVGSGRTAFDNLVQASREMIARTGKAPWVMPAWFPRSAVDVELFLKDADMLHALGLSEEDIHVFGERLWQLMTSCSERALDEYERLSWSSFLGSDQRSRAFREFLARGLTRTLVAATPQDASTEVGGLVLTELVFATARPGTSDDRLLNGPTNDVWITPWLEYLRTRGVDYRLNAEVAAIHCADRRITGITVREDGREYQVSGDYYLGAVPVERMNQLLTKEMIDIDPVLAGIRTLAGDVAWMNGIQLYLSQRVSIVNGHVTYVDTPWALTSISQAQFWKRYDLSDYGDGTVEDILSVDISDWQAPGVMNCVDEPPSGTDPNQKPLQRCKCADECTPDQVMVDVWEQLKRSVNVEGREVLTDDLLRHWYLDRDIHRAKDGLGDREPLLVNKAGRWVMRPDAHTLIPNLLLASDYVRTNTNLATMEAANEAARRAVNSIIDRSGANVPYCKVWKLYEPWVLAPLRWHDRRRFSEGLPWDPRPPLLLRVTHYVAALVARIIAAVSRLA